MPATVSSAPSNPCRESEKRRKLPPLFSFIAWLPFPAGRCGSVHSPTAPAMDCEGSGAASHKTVSPAGSGEKPPQLSCFRLGGAEAPALPACADGKARSAFPLPAGWRRSASAPAMSHAVSGAESHKAQVTPAALAEKPAQLSLLLRSKKGRDIPASPFDRPGNRLSRYTARRRS